MAYSQVQVMLGGAVHIPIVIGFLKFCDNKTSKSYQDQKAAEEKAAEAAKAKALADAQAKAAAAAKTKAAKEAKAKADAEAKSKDSENSCLLYTSPSPRDS